MAESRFTPEMRGALLERFSAGMSNPEACRSVGLAEKTLKHWLTKGRNEPDTEYGRFVLDVEAARARSKAQKDGPMDEEELVLHVSRLARMGSVQAMRLRWEMLQKSKEPDADAERPKDPLAGVDELAKKRAAVH